MNDMKYPAHVWDTKYIIVSITVGEESATKMQWGLLGPHSQLPVAVKPGAHILQNQTPALHKQEFEVSDLL